MVAADLDEAAEMAALGAKGAFGEAGFSTLARRRVMLPEDAQYLFDLASMLTTLGVYPRWSSLTLLECARACPAAILPACCLLASSPDFECCLSSLLGV